MYYVINGQGDYYCGLADDGGSTCWFVGPDPTAPSTGGMQPRRYSSLTAAQAAVHFLTRTDPADTFMVQPITARPCATCGAPADYPCSHDPVVCTYCGADVVDGPLVEAALPRGLYHPWCVPQVVLPPRLVIDTDQGTAHVVCPTCDEGFECAPGPITAGAWYLEHARLIHHDGASHLWAPWLLFSRQPEHTYLIG